jgi:hypothetical protein
MRVAADGALVRMALAVGVAPSRLPESRALAVVRETRTGVPHEPWTLADLSRARLGLGDGRGARASAEEAIAAAERLGTREYELSGRLALAHALTSTQTIKSFGDQRSPRCPIRLASATWRASHGRAIEEWDEARASRSFRPQFNAGDGRARSRGT